MELNTLIGLLGGFLLLALILFLHHKWKGKGREELSIKRFMDNAESWGESHATACGSCAVKESCATSCTTSAPKKEKPITYYDDEELDLYSGRDPHSYSTEEEEEFREVYHTLLENDREGWLKSLERRKIALPATLLSEIEKDLRLGQL